MLLPDLQASVRTPDAMYSTFELYLDDDRYAVPTLKLIDAADEADALAQAHRLVRESPHHRGAELCLDGVRIAALGSCAHSLPAEIR